MRYVRKGESDGTNCQFQIHVRDRRKLARMECMTTISAGARPKGGAGKRIRQLREERGLTQAEVAAGVGIRQSTLSDLERGAVAGRALGMLTELALFFDVSADFLLGIEKESRPVQDAERLNPLETDHIRLLRELSSERLGMVLRMTQLLHGDDARWRDFERTVVAIEAEDRIGFLGRSLGRLFALTRELGSVEAAIVVIASEITGTAQQQVEKPVEEG